MKKIFMFLAVMGVMTISAHYAAAQDAAAAEPAATEVAAGLEANFDLTGDNIKCLVGGEYKFTVDPEAAKVYIAQ